MFYAVSLTASETPLLLKLQTLMAMLTTLVAMLLSTDLTGSQQISPSWFEAFAGRKVDFSPTSLPLQLHSAIRPSDKWKHRAGYVP